LHSRFGSCATDQVAPLLAANAGGHNAANGRLQLLAFALTIVVLESELTIPILTTAQNDHFLPRVGTAAGVHI